MDTLFCVQSNYDLLCPLLLLVFGVRADAFLLLVRLGMLDGLDKGGSLSVIALSISGVSVAVCWSGCASGTKPVFVEPAVCSVSATLLVLPVTSVF